MGSVAASGGYYIAMPAKFLMAEQTTITGSIGVYAAFPNIATLADKYGVRMEIIKAGDIKDSGSMFHRMTPQERHLWQDMVDHAYERFLTVVEEGRPEQFGNYWFTRTLKQELKDETRPLPVDEAGNGEPDKPDAGKTVTYVRRRADGGIFTAAKALKYGLIDKIGYLDDAIKEAKQQAGLSENVKVIMYERPTTLFGALLGAQASPPAAAQLDQGRVAQGAVPRRGDLAPQCDLASLLTAACRE
jgi:protease-4